jgi:hypothetical protein
LDISYSDCEGFEVDETIAPLGTSNKCVNCVLIASGPWEWAACA